MINKRETQILERRFFPEDAVIIKEGEMGDVAFLIQSGNVEIFKTIEGQRVHLADIASGDIFGEMSLLFQENRTASARAKTDCNLIFITGPTLESKLQKSDPTVRAIVSALVKRLDVSNTKIAEKDYFGNMGQTIQDIFLRFIEQMPEDRQRSFKKEAGPHLEQLLAVINKYLMEINSE